MAFACACLPDALARQPQHERSDKQHDREESGCDKAMHARLRGDPGAAEQTADAQAGDTPQASGGISAPLTPVRPSSFLSEPTNLSNDGRFCYGDIRPSWQPHQRVARMD